MLQLQSQIKLQQINEREHFGNETHKTQKKAIEAALAFVQDWVDSDIDEDEFRKEFVDGLIAMRRSNLFAWER